MKNNHSSHLQKVSSRVGALVTFLTGCSCVSPVQATEQGTLIHFPAKLAEDWAPAEAAAHAAARTLGPGAWLRFDNLWHEQN